MEPYEIEAFWDDLLAYVEERRVIPVVGAELLMVRNGDGRPIPLYRAVAESLLCKYLPEARPALPEHRELSEAVCAVAEAGTRRPRLRVHDLYRPIHDILETLVGGLEIPAPLRQLAAIRDFDLFATTTPDNLLAKAINVVRFEGVEQTDEIEYAPKLPTDRRCDIPVQPSSMYAAVFYLFGKTDVSSFYAIHDEDALEFAFTLQAGNGPERMFSQLKNRNLLLIGCTFCDWLVPFFLRLSNSERLFSVRTKKEFLVGGGTTRNRDFVAFLDYFSQDTRCYAVDPSTFVDELHRRWSARNPGAVPKEIGTPAKKSGDAIFISYSNDDVGAAKRLNDDLAEIGGDVAWFDKTALHAGDKWEPHIKSAIQRCTFFLPLISVNTERRTDAFFREEWLEAVERARKIQGRKFIFPIVIDPEFNGATGRYSLVPEQFRAFQYSHAPGGQMSQGLRDELCEQLRALRRARVA